MENNFTFTTIFDILTENAVGGVLLEPQQCSVDEQSSSNIRIESKRKRILRAIGRTFARFMIFLGTTVLLVAFALYCLMFALAKGPSPTAKNLFVLSVRETSAIGFLANLFFDFFSNRKRKIHFFLNHFFISWYRRNSFFFSIIQR